MRIFTFSFYYVFQIGALVCAALCGASFYVLNHQVIDFSALEHYNSSRASIVLDDEGNEWTRFQLDRREPVVLEHMPAHLINAFVAAEDWDFFSHAGISLKGIVRSLCVNLYNRRIVQGASTITQQLVKLLFLDGQKTFSRKIKEQVWAILVERQFTKEQIIEAYLNHIYFGLGIYGVQAASIRFWNRSIDHISIAQAATLAAVVRSPARYCPLLCPLSSHKRRDLIIRLMHDRGFITQEECADALAEPFELMPPADMCCAPHAKESLRTFLEERFGKALLYTGGLLIKTTINQSMQKEAHKAFAKQCAALRDELHCPIDGALIAMESQSGEIRALVGGFDFAQSKFNRALQAHRQIGSVFKPLVYAAALEHGALLRDTEIDEPIELAQGNGTIWRPKNYNKEFDGQITRAYALSHSNNIVTIKTLLHTGIESVIDCAQRCQLPGPFPPYPSLALGCTDVGLLDVVGMFNIFAHNGWYVEPHMISWVKDQWGTKIYKAHSRTLQALDARVSGQIAKVLTLGLKRIRIYFDAWIRSEALCKTGTTNDSRTCWFVGSVPGLTTALYVGCDDNRSMGKNVYPIRTAFPIWLEFNRAIEHGESKKFSYDPSLKEITINERTGAIITEPTASPENITILC